MAKSYGKDGTAGISTQTGGKHKFGVVRSDTPRAGDSAKHSVTHGAPPGNSPVYNAGLGTNVAINATDPDTDARSAPSDWASPGVNRESHDLTASEQGTGKV